MSDEILDDPTSKKTSEEYLIEFDFSKVWITGDSVTLASSSVTALNNVDADKTSDVTEQSTLAISNSGKGLVIRVKGGVITESPYMLTAKIKTAQLQRWELEVPMVIF